MTTALEFQAVSRRFAGPDGPVFALTGVTLSIRAGEVVVVQGPSGSGKTTLLLTAGGLLRPDDGRVLVTGSDPYAMTPERRSRLRGDRIGFVFQQFHLIPYLSVLDNILVPSVRAPGPAPAERAAELLAHFDLTRRARHLPAQLSTGERQRAALARALLNQPALVLADEPTGNLDSGNAETIFRYFAEFARNGGAVLVVSHDERAAAHAARVLYLDSGRLANAAPADQ